MPPPTASSATRSTKPQPQPQPHSRPHPPASTVSEPASRSRRHTLPFSFPPLFQPNTSTSLVSSTAEGKPIPVDDSTAQHRTSALREFNTNFPSRTGPQSSTYSQPVIVRSYYSPPLPTRPTSTDRGVVIVNGRRGHRTSWSESGGPADIVKRVLPFAARMTPSRNGMLAAMARSSMKKGPESPEEAKLPPIEAFRFKSFMASIEDEMNGSDINADLDRIAEICAKSRYSLSNQYEVHYSPHGSGTSFMSPAEHGDDGQGPTLQVVSSDDERAMRRQRRRPMAMRRNSRAMGTLETIMSSSRSSDEDKTKKKSAAEIAEEVRGRAARKGSRHGSNGSASSQSGREEQICHGEQSSQISRTRRSGSLALIDGSRHSMNLTETMSPRNSTVGLVSEPAEPKTSSSQLEIRTTVEAPAREQVPPPVKPKMNPVEGIEQPLAQGAISSVDYSNSNPGLISTLSNWVAWGVSGTLPSGKGRAEGSLRDLLKNKDIKGKGVETGGYQ